LRSIFNEETRAASSSVSDNVSFVAVQSSMYKRRRKALPVLPTHADGVPEAVAETRYATLNGSVFFRGSVEADGSAIMFASDEQLQLLSTATTVFIDATFKTVPRLYYQLFTVFVQQDVFLFPVFYALMTRKTRELYSAVFGKLKEAVPSFSPVNIRAMADFEEAAVSAFKHIFGEAVSVHGCWFHFTQAVIKRAKKMGLTTPYRDDSTARKCIRALTCLPLLPEIDMANAIEDIRQQCAAACDEFQPMLNQLCSYVKKHWINKTSIGPGCLTVRNCDVRTNNGVESFHASFRRRVQVTHPNIYTFLTRLQEATSDYMADVRRLRNNKQKRRPKRKSNLMNDRHIKQLIERYDAGNYTTFQFLSAASYCADNTLETLNQQATDSDTNSDTQSTDDDSDANELSSNNSADEKCIVCLT